jgi:hypothetical protein
MTVEKVRETIVRINDMAGDDEAAHSLEDKLHHDVLEAIAAGKCENPRELAREVIQTKNIQFSRWCA